MSRRSLLSDFTEAQIHKMSKNPSVADLPNGRKGVTRPVSPRQFTPRRPDLGGKAAARKKDTAEYPGTSSACRL